MSVPLGQAVADVWSPDVELRRDSLVVLLRVMTDDLQASPDAASLAVAELLPLLHVQFSMMGEGGWSDASGVGGGDACVRQAGDAAASPHPSLALAIKTLSHPMIFKSVIPPVQRLASYSQSLSLGAVCPHALPSVAGILSAARPWLHVRSSIPPLTAFVTLSTRFHCIPPLTIPAISS